LAANLPNDKRKIGGKYTVYKNYRIGCIIVIGVKEPEP
jgi:hypothetical protein